MPKSALAEMATYAQTNLQLFNQLRRDGYSVAEMASIHRAYDLAVRLCACLYRPSGKTFIAHLVGTASILSSLRVPAELVAAGLLHSVYTHGDFGGWRPAISDANREEIKRIVGAKVEEYIARYALLPWNTKAIQAADAKLDGLDPESREVLLMRLANQLEDLLDRGLLYWSPAEVRVRYRDNSGQMMVEIAKKMGFPQLAAEFELLLIESSQDEIPVELRGQSRPSFLLSPRSIHRTAEVAFDQEVICRLYAMRSAIIMQAKRMCWKSYRVVKKWLQGG